MPPSAAWIPRAVKESVARGVVPKGTTHALIMSADATRTIAAEVTSAFPPGALHTFAAKANSLYGYLEVLEKAGFGCETASIGEFEMANRVFAADKVVFDSPVKTIDELKRALYLPCFLNVDNFQELERIAALHAEKPVVATIGLRVNPQVGFGAIGALSTGNATSKFGVGLDDLAEEIVAAYKAHSFLTMIHVHTGSQGIGIPLMTKSIAKVVGFVESKLPAGQVRTLDIGGGLPVNFDSDEWTPSFADYGNALKEAVPSLWAPDAAMRVVTEFGRAIAAKAGVFVSRVEYTKTNGGRYIVQQHVGADVLIRQCWAPQEWQVRLAVFDGESGEERTGDIVVSDVAGPCCFGSDLAARERPMPRAHVGDVIVLKDLGAYAHSSFSRYNLRQAPAVYLHDEAASDASGAFRMIRRAETVAETLEFMMPGF
jgi:diaminopimelate decarboxylase